MMKRCLHILIILLLICIGCKKNADVNNTEPENSADTHTNKTIIQPESTSNIEETFDEVINITENYDFDNDGMEDAFSVYYTSDINDVQSRKAEIVFGNTAKDSICVITERTDEKELYIYPQNKITFIPTDSGVLILQNAFCPFKKPNGNTVIPFYYDGINIYALEALYDNFNPSGMKEPVTIKFIDDSKYTLTYTFVNTFDFEGVVSDELLKNPTFHKDDFVALGDSGVISINTKTGQVIMRIAVFIGGKHHESYLDITYDFDEQNKMYAATDALYKYGLRNYDVDFYEFYIEHDTIYTDKP